MRKSLLKKGLVIGILLILIFLNFIPITGSNSLSLKKKFEMLDTEDEDYNDYMDFNDIIDKQPGQFLSYKKSDIYKDPTIFPDKIKKEMPLIKQNDLEKIRSYEKESKFEALLDNKDYIPHDPINIQRNSDFTEENGVTGGSGTEEDPFIIEGWEINGSGYGIRIFYTTSYFIVRNCRLTGTYAIDFREIKFGAISTVITNGRNIGSHIYSSSNITIQDSILYSSGSCSLYLSDAMFISVDNCSASCFGYYCIFLHDLHSSTLSNMTISDSESFGTCIRDCSNVLIRDCNVYNNRYGIDLYRSKNIVLRNNNIYSNVYNLALHGPNSDHFYHDIDTSNTVDGKPVYYIYNQSDLIFDGSEDIGFLGLIKCTRISVEGLTMDIGNRHGILLVETTDSSIISSTFSNSTFGIKLFKSINNTIIDCKTSGKDTIYGIELFYGSSNNNIQNCEVKGGILIERAPSNIMRNNIITGNYLNFQVFGNKISHFLQDVDDSNTINGKPIYYFIEEDNLDISGDDIGYLGFVNCSNVNVHDATIQYVGSGVLLVNTDAVVENCELRACSWGVHLFMCSNVEIIKCNFKNNFCGIYLHYSSYNQVFRCDLSRNWWHGCLLENSDNNSVERCNVYYTGMDAFFLEDSHDNEIHYNNIAYSEQSGLFAIFSSVDATVNWWGSATGPGGEGPGFGDRIVSVESTVLFDPWLESPVSRVKQLNYGFLGMFLRLLERFPLLERLLSLLL